MRDAGGEGVRDHVANALQMVVLEAAVGLYPETADMLAAVRERLEKALALLDDRPATVVAGQALAAGMTPPPSIEWVELDLHGVPPGTFPPGAQVFQGTVADGFLMAVTFGEGMGPRGRPSIGMTIAHIISELYRTPGRGVRFEEVVATVRKLWPAGTFAGLVVAGGESPEAIAPAIYLSEVYPTKVAGPGTGGVKLWTPGE